MSGADHKRSGSRTVVAGAETAITEVKAMKLWKVLTAIVTLILAGGANFRW